MQCRPRKILKYSYTILLLHAFMLGRAQLLEDSAQAGAGAEKAFHWKNAVETMDRLGQVVFFNKSRDEGLDILRQSVSLAAPLKDGQYRAHTYAMLAMSYSIMGDAPATKRFISTVLSGM